MVTKTDLRAELKSILERHEGPERAITAGELARMFGYRDDRPIRLAIRALIEGEGRGVNGLPVAANTDSKRGPLGYFIPTAPEQAQEYADSVKGRLIEDAYRRRDFKVAAEQWFKAKLDIKPPPVEQGRLI